MDKENKNIDIMWSIFFIMIFKHFKISGHVSLHISGVPISPIVFKAAATIYLLFELKSFFMIFEERSKINDLGPIPSNKKYTYVKQDLD